MESFDASHEISFVLKEIYDHKKLDNIQSFIDQFMPN